MSAPALPEFDHVLQLSQGNLDAAELSECHGLLCGLLCRDVNASADDFMHHLAASQLLVNPGAALRSVMLETWESTARQLEDEELGFSLWLPDDEDALEERTVSLGQWCSGFLVGLASGGEIQTLTDDAKEGIEDLQQIARAGLSDEVDDAEDSEEDEVAFAEIVEYVRVVALMMREDMRGPGQSDPVH